MTTSTQEMLNKLKLSSPARPDSKLGKENALQAKPTCPTPPLSNLGDVLANCLNPTSPKKNLRG